MTAATLLIVEDDGILAANLEILLTGLGYRVLGPVATGEEAIALLNEQPADLVLMDIELAGALNGIETAEALNRDLDLPIVFLTGFSHDPLLDQAKIVAPYGYLIKPVPERELAATVAMSLHRHALDRQLSESRKALAASEARYRHLFDNSPLGIFRTTLDGRALMINSEMANMLGCDSAAEAIGAYTDLASQLYVDPARREEFVHLLRTQGEVRNFEYQARKRDGGIIWISMDARLATIDGADGTPSSQIIDGFALDITERRQAKERLRESEANFRSFFASMTDMCLVADLEGRILATNNALSHTLGYSGRELTTMRMVDLHAPDKREEVAVTTAALLNKEIKDCRLPLQTKNGESVPVISRAWFGNWDGKNCIYFTCRNVTSEQEAEQRFEHLFRHNPALMALNNVNDQRFVDVNDAWLAETGYSRSEVIGRTPLELHLFPVPAQYEAAEKQLHEEGRIDNLELHVRCKNGNVLSGLFSGEIVPSQGHFYFLTVMIDITDRKRAEVLLRESESRYRELVENANSIILRMDAEGRLTFFNEYAQRFFGYSAEEVIGRNVVGTIVPETDSAGRDLREMIADIGRHPSLYATNENENIRRDGSRVWTSWTNKLFYDDSGAVTEILCIGNDITDRRRAEEENRTLQAQLLHAQKLEAIGTLAGGIAHDFNNILAAVIGYADMARDSVDDHTPLSKDLDNILKAGHRAKDLVKQILAFSRQNSTEPAVLFPALIVKEVVKLLRPSLPTTIAIEQDIDPKAGPVMIDPTNLHQMLMNLCTNAFHAMEEQGGVLTLGLRRAAVAEVPPTANGAASGDYVVLTVADTGTGIPESIRHRIFDPFFTTKGAGKGTGMGLAILHGLVTGAGGWVELDTTPGKGSTFRIFFPVVAQPIAADRSAAEQAPVGSGHILFVDDEAILTEMAKTMLEQLGYLVTVRTSSLEALATFQNHPDLYDLVITDQTMPGMTGIDLARRLLTLRPELPIILCTGYSGLISRDQARAAGIRDLALKPLTKKELASLIKKVLNPG